MAKAIHWMISRRNSRIGRFTSLDSFSLSYLSQDKSGLREKFTSSDHGDRPIMWGLNCVPKSTIKNAQNEIEKFKVEVKRLKAESHHKQSEI